MIEKIEYSAKAIALPAAPRRAYGPHLCQNGAAMSYAIAMQQPSGGCVAAHVGDWPLQPRSSYASEGEGIVL